MEFIYYKNPPNYLDECRVNRISKDIHLTNDSFLSNQEKFIKRVIKNNSTQFRELEIGVYIVSIDGTNISKIEKIEF